MPSFINILTFFNTIYSIFIRILSWWRGFVKHTLCVAQRERLYHLWANYCVLKRALLWFQKDTWIWPTCSSTLQYHTIHHCSWSKELSRLQTNWSRYFSILLSLYLLFLFKIRKRRTVLLVSRVFMRIG